jgi:23S rRNA (guanosine2251-2'-O)-methyltransferase
MCAQHIILEGGISILAAIQARSREIHVIYLQKRKRSDCLALVEYHARLNHIPVQWVNEEDIQRITIGHTHGGVVALVGPRRLLPLESLGRDEACPLIFMLDGIEDPFNFGQAVRAIYAAGAHGLVVRSRDWGSASGVVARSSAGAYELIALAEVESSVEAAEHFRAHGLVVACTCAHKSAYTIYHADLTGPTFVFIGGERRGITRSMLRDGDMLLQVPYGSDFRHSLSAASAAAVIAFEAFRQRIYRDPLGRFMNDKDLIQSDCSAPSARNGG